MRLLGVELTRFRSRRAIVLIVLAAALLTALITTTTVWDTRPVSAAELAEAQAMAEREAQQDYVQEDLRRCEEAPQEYIGPEATAADCQEMVPQAEWFVGRATLDLQEQASTSGVAVILLLAALLLVVGTTFAGADWASGSLSNQLLFEPRRGRVWLAKAGAVLVGALVTAAVVVAAFWLALFAVAASRGIATSAQVQEAIAWSSLRGVALVVAGAVGAYILTMLLRHTVGALATLFALVVGGEILLATLPFEGIGRWSLGNNVLAWLLGGYDYYDPNISCPPGPEMCDQMVHLSLAASAWFLGLLLLAVGAVSLMSFRRRDIP
ncbi:MAG TPA: hypothetical protein VFZ64_10085 [Nocardioidaceae bacterium]